MSRNSAKNQRERIKKALREAGKGGLSTIDLRHKYDVISAPPRIYELRHWFGLNIHTVYTVERTPEGNEHKVGRYLLMPGTWKGKTEARS